MLVPVYFHPPHRPVAGEPVVSSQARLQRRRHAAEPGGHGVPLVEAHSAPEGVAAGGALGALLGRHLQELSGLAGEGLVGRKEETKWKMKRETSFSFRLEVQRKGKASGERLDAQVTAFQWNMPPPPPRGNLILTSCFTLCQPPRSHLPPAEPSSPAHLPDSALQIQPFLIPDMVGCYCKP